MNHLQESNVTAAQDSLALLFVCLEQSAMDQGNMQVGLLLSLTEDPPQSLFTGRSLASGANPKPFAPTAHQRWVTIALQYLKELDVISTRRSEANASRGGASSSQQGSQDDAQAKAKAQSKKKPKGKSKGQKNQFTEGEEEN